MRRLCTAAIAGLTVLSAGAGAPVEAAAGMKFINVHGDPRIILTLTPSYLPDGRVEDFVHLVNRSRRDYCLRFEIYDDAWVHFKRRVTVVTAPPGSAYEVAKIKIIAAGGKYRYKFKGVYLNEAGIQGRDCRKAFPANAEY